MVAEHFWLWKQSRSDIPVIGYPFWSTLVFGGKKEDPHYRLSGQLLHSDERENVRRLFGSAAGNLEEKHHWRCEFQAVSHSS
jgi:hypothetical protein